MVADVPFEVGRGYLRPVVADFVKSRQGQTGIIWGPAEPGVVVCTSGGQRGKNAGYHDKQNEDGSWDYYGQGQEGDQNPDAFGNALLIEASRSVLFFLTKEPTSAMIRKQGHRRKTYVYVGAYCVGGWQFVVPETGSRKGDRLIMFNLMPTVGSGSSPPVATGLSVLPTLQALRLRVIANSGSPAPSRQRVVDYRVRSDQVRDYAVLRANGKCERCGNPAPFVTAGGWPYIEVHHIFRLADDGPDAPDNVIGLCPNCHRMAHHGVNKQLLREQLHSIALQREALVASGQPT